MWRVCARIVSTALLLGIYAAVPYWVWASRIAQARDPSYIAFTHALGMTARYRYSLDPNQFLELRIPAGTPLTEVRQRVPHRYVVFDGPVESTATCGDCTYAIALDERKKTEFFPRASLNFRQEPDGRTLLVCSDADIDPIHYPQFVLPAVWTVLWVAGWLAWLPGWSRRSQRRARAQDG